MCTPALAESRLALFDIDEKRLRQSETMLRCLNQNLGNHASVEVYHDRKEALRDADYVINAIAVGEYDPYIVSDFEIPENMACIRPLPIRLVWAGCSADCELFRLCWILPEIWKKSAPTHGF